MAERPESAGVRLDKWLWAARFFKTRTLAADEVGRGRVTVNGQAAKPAREMRVGDRIELKIGGFARQFAVTGVSGTRGSATIAATLYTEDEASIRAREEAQARRRLAPEPASSIEAGRPTKRNRRQLAEWQRWSATAKD